MVTRRAFTLVELLIVVAIIALLSALTVVATTAIRRAAKKETSRAICALLYQAVQLTAANRGGSVAPSEHPLAGTRATRLQFRGDRGSWTDLATTGEALIGVEPSAVTDATAAKRVCAAGDRFADPRLPLLFGLARERIGVLGADLQAVRRARRLPRPTAPATTIPAPYDATTYPDVKHLQAPTALAEANQRTLDYVLGSAGTAPELARLGALFTPPDDDAANRVLPPVAITGADNGGRVWSEAAVARWRDDREAGASVDAGTGDWRRYRLRGLAVYDAWRREVLYSIDARGRMRVASAGADGVFRWHPGGDGAYATAGEAELAAGDDRDGARDNIEVSE